MKTAGILFGAVLVTFGLTSVLFAQGPDTLWTKCYGGADNDANRSVQQTSDSGYIITGYTMSFGAGGYDVWLIKTDANGDTLWTNTYGGTDSDIAYSGQQTSDGGYIIAGYTKSFGVGDYDVWLIKTDSNGDTLWTNTYGGTGTDRCYSSQQTSDGGYIACGYTKSFGAGLEDVYLIKTDANGDTLWTNTYGGTDIDIGYYIQQTSDSGYIIAGKTRSFGAGSEDVYLIKTDANGDTLWTKTYGAGGKDKAYSVQQTSDGGYIAVGWTNSFTSPYDDVYLIKTDANGDTLWTKRYGGAGNDGGRSVQQTRDGGYIIAGYTMSFGLPMFDFYLIKTDANGDTLWTKMYGDGGSQIDWAYSVQQTTDGGYIIAGDTKSFGAGDYDVWLLRVETHAPDILSVTDILDDQGKWVRITWAASYRDAQCVNPITQYGIWRRIDASAKTTTDQNGDGIVIPGIEGTFTLEGWDAIGSVPAIQDSIYNFVAPTLVDSNTTGINYSVFIITAHTQDPLDWIASEPDSGYSVDNIPPEAPYNLTGEVINSDVLLTWQVLLSYPDFSHFSVYRDTTSGFVPGDANRIGTSEVPTYTDSSVVAGTYYYVVSAVDVNGNESDYSNEVEVMVTGIKETEGNVVPTFYALSQNYPNPFKTETEIYYQLPQPNTVTIAIYNISGRRIKTLVNEHRDAGYYTVRWDGRSQDNQKVSNGVYSCRMVVGKYTSVKKIILTR